MRPLELLFVYLLIGAGVAAAWHRSARPGLGWVLPLWPLFVPTLLSAASPAVVEVPLPAEGPWSARIQDSVATLARALASWEALPDAALCRGSLEAAERGLRALALRHAQLEEVLESPENDAQSLRAQLREAPEAARALLEARLENIRRLEALRDEARDELERGLAGLADLATRVHLARFTGETAQELSDQLARLARAVDGASEVARLGAPRRARG